MGFNTEKSMKEVAKPVLKKALGGPNVHIVPEFSYSAGRTDLVYTCVSEAYLKRRVEELGIRIPIENKDHLKAFLRLHNRGPVTREYFFDLGNSSSSRKSLEWLEANGFVKETDDGKIQTAQYLRKHITTSYAVELKLSKWKQALKQANRARSFAEYQYVALDDSHILPALENLSEFKKLNVGLISLDDDGSYHIHFEPEKESPFSSLNNWYLNEATLADIRS